MVDNPVNKCISSWVTNLYASGTKSSRLCGLIKWHYGIQLDDKVQNGGNLERHENILTMRLEKQWEM